MGPTFFQVLLVVIKEVEGTFPYFSLIHVATEVMVLMIAAEPGQYGGEQ